MEEVSNENWSEAAEDILTNVFLRLSVKSLIICKSVCKSWRGLISSPSFIRSQLNESKENPTFILFPYVREKWYDDIMKFDGDIWEKIIFSEDERLYSCELLCSFNGLICFTRCSTFAKPLEIYICNPATREVLFLPKSPHYKYVAEIGVAFGPQINEYKVYGFFDKSGEFQDDKHIECEVYSSVTKSWKGIGHIGQLPMSSRHLSVNGTVYWFMSMSSTTHGLIPGSILAIDREENFIRISLPREVVSRHVYIVEFAGCLSIVSSRDAWSRRFDLWVLEDHNKSIWVKKCSDIESTNFQYVSSVVARKNEILFILEQKRCLVYDVDNETWRTFNRSGVWRRSPTAFVFTESLLPCGELLTDE